MARRQLHCNRRKFGAGMDAPFRDVYNPVSIVNVYLMTIARLTRVVVGGLADDGQPISCGTLPGEACALSQETARCGNDPCRSLFRYRDAGRGLFPG